MAAFQPPNSSHAGPDDRIIKAYRQTLRRPRQLKKMGFQFFSAPQTKTGSGSVWAFLKKAERNQIKKRVKTQRTDDINAAPGASRTAPAAGSTRAHGSQAYLLLQRFRPLMGLDALLPATAAEAGSGCQSGTSAAKC